ncbi:MAG: hypothetical protein RJA49_1507 [Actinomycetota bacterium]
MRVKNLIGIAVVAATAVAALATTSTTSASGVTGHSTTVIASHKAQVAGVDPAVAAEHARIGAALPNVVWGPATVSDPANDPRNPLNGASNNVAQGDITGVRVATNNEPGVPSLFVSVSVRSWVRPTNTQWVGADTFIDWIADTNGDGTPNYVLEMVNFHGLLYADVYHYATGKHLCNAIPLFDKVAKSYGIYAPLSCLANPKVVSLFAVMQYDNGVAAARDFAPNLVDTPPLGTRIWPNKPGVPVAASAPASLDVKWTAPASPLWPVTDYIVQYSLAAPVAWKTFADGVSSVPNTRITGLTPGKAFIVRVFAKNKVGNSVVSGTSAARVALKAGVLPAAPGIPTFVTHAVGTITVAWAAPTTPGSHPIIDYQVETSANNGVTWTRFEEAVRTTRSTVITGLTPTSRSKVRVRAKTFAGVGAWSPAGGPFQPITVPTAPTALANEATGVSGELHLSWATPISDGGSAINSYRVFYRPYVAPTKALTIAPRIVGGVSSAISATPWQVRVRIDESAGFDLCGGTLIDRQWVLTAAHCAKGVAAGRFLVHAGIRLQTDMTALNGYHVDKVIVHPGYVGDVTPTDHRNDLALLHLTTVAVGTDIATIGLFDAPTGPIVKANSAEISGWGLTAEKGIESDSVQRALVDVLANSSCAAYGAAFDTVTNTMLCAGKTAGGVDTCQGDSGGPLVVGYGTPTPLLAGVTSWGGACAAANRPGVYVRVSTYVNWIQSQVETLWPHIDVTCTSPCNAAALTGLVDGQAYEIRVRAHNALGYGAAAMTNTFVPGTPVAPTGLQAVANPGAIVSLTWTAPALDGGSPITDYAYSLDGGINWVSTGSVATGAAVGGLTAGETLHFLVRAVNANGPSVPVGPVDVVVLA